MRRRSNSHSPISLFTFLDTLVCTMGSLILMLLAMTPKIKERAEARELARLAMANPAAALVDAPPAALLAADDEEEQATAREKRRAGWLESTEKARTALAAREADYRQRRQLLKAAAARLKELDDHKLEAHLKAQSIEDTSQSLTELETKLEKQQAAVAQKIAQTRKEIDLLNRKQATAASEYALVPYDGTSGTVRRPIYVECTKRGFRFLPENETLSPLDLEGFRENYNPLLNGTQALLRHWSRKRRESGGKEPEPYVLLLVRPSGCLNYYVARNSLSSLGTNFGYELIEEDWKLNIPAADPIAKTVLRETLDITVQGHEKMKDELAQAAQRGSFGSGGRDWKRGGGFDDFSPGDGGDDFGDAPFGGARGDRGLRGRPGPPSRAGRDSSGAGYGTAADESSTGGNAPSGRGMGNGQGTATGKPGSRSAAAIGGGTKPGGAGGRSATGGIGDDSPDAGVDNSGGSAGGSLALRNSSGRAAGGDAGTAAGGDSSVANGSGGQDAEGGATSGTIGNGSGGRSAASGRPGRPGARPASISGASSDTDGDDGGTGGDAPLELPVDYAPRHLPGGGGAGGNGDRDSPSGTLAQDRADRSSRAGAGAAGGDSPGGSRSSSGSANRKGASQSGGTAADASSGADDSGSGGPSLPGLEAGASDSDGSGGSPLQMGGPGANIRLGSKSKRPSSAKDDDSDSGPRLGDDEGKTGGGKGRRGPRLWGRAKSKASIGLEKKMEIRVLADKIMVGSRDVVIPVGRGEKVEEMIDRVVVGIDHHVSEKFGDPPESYYWIPTVKFVIYPGGNIYYERLHGPLEEKWGIVSTVEFAPEPKPAASGTGARR